MFELGLVQEKLGNRKSKQQNITEIYVLFINIRNCIKYSDPISPGQRNKYNDKKSNNSKKATGYLKIILGL